MDDLISRQAAIKAIPKRKEGLGGESWMMTYRRSGYNDCIDTCLDAIQQLPSAQSARLTDDDFETIRIHLNAQKENLCNQHRWKEAEEYQRIIDRFMAFASAQPERKKGKWLTVENPNYSPFDCSPGKISVCSVCGYAREQYDFNYCPNCGADMREEKKQ